MKNVNHNVHNYQQIPILALQWDLYQLLLSEKATNNAIKHQHNEIIPMMTSLFSVSIFHYFSSQVFLMLNIPVSCLLKGICSSYFSFLEK